MTKDKVILLMEAYGFYDQIEESVEGSDVMFTVKWIRKSDGLESEPFTSSSSTDAYMESALLAFAQIILKDLQACELRVS